MSTTMTVPPPAKTMVLEADYDSHPSELVTGGEIDSKYSVADLKKAIPAHCFQPSYTTSLWYLTRDLTVCATLMSVAYNLIPHLEFSVLRYAAWLIYGYIQGQQMTGIWVLGHECGHSAFSPSPLLNDSLGWLLHSSLLTPYFSWQSTHRRHHIYANNLAKDHNYVPPTKSSYIKLLGITTDQLDEMTEDSPIATFGRILLQQVLGWPWYLIANITATGGSLTKERKKGEEGKGGKARFLGTSHFHPFGELFRPQEWCLVLASDVGLGLMFCALWYASTFVGWGSVALLYVQPYLWVNHWIVAITYLHHTHPNVPKYEPEAWNFLKGATATVDRGLGFGGKHLMHNIADYHLIHHLFSRIPQYHAEEATKAIMPMLGVSYREDKQRSFWIALWESFTMCQYVEPSDEDAMPKDREMMYRAGPAPPVERMMGRGGVVLV